MYFYNHNTGFFWHVYFQNTPDSDKSNKRQKINSHPPIRTTHRLTSMNFLHKKKKIIRKTQLSESSQKGRRSCYVKGAPLSVRFGARPPFQAPLRGHQSADDDATRWRRTVGLCPRIRVTFRVHQLGSSAELMLRTSPGRALPRHPRGCSNTAPDRFLCSFIHFPLVMMVFIRPYSVP